MKKKGFTIIELVVVVAIIAVLSSIVLVSTLNYIEKGKNAAIKGNMANLITHGVAYLLDNNNYNNFCADGKTLVFLNAVNKITDTYECICDTVGCANAGKWCMAAKLKGTIGSKANYFCVDSSGKKIEAPCKISGCLTCLGGACSDAP